MAPFLKTSPHKQTAAPISHNDFMIFISGRGNLIFLLESNDKPNLLPGKYIVSTRNSTQLAIAAVTVR